MRAVIQRVSEASVSVDSAVVGRISRGILIFLGVGKNDTAADAEYLAGKIAQLRIFEDGQGKMNLSAVETDAAALVISQFTLYGDCAKGRRPSFDAAAGPKKAEELYEYFTAKLREQKVKVQTGRFRAMMKVALLNDGPVTFILDSGR